MTKALRVIVAGSRDCTSYDVVKEAIEKGKEVLKISIGTIIHGDCRGVDKVAGKYAEDNKINVIVYPAKWNDISVEGAIVKERMNPWKKKMEKYNANAGFQRNTLMAENADALIAINLGTNGTDDMIKKAKEKGLLVYEYIPGTDVDEFETYKF